MKNRKQIEARMAALRGYFSEALDNPHNVSPAEQVRLDGLFKLMLLEVTTCLFFKLVEIEELVSSDLDAMKKEELH